MLSKFKGWLGCSWTSNISDEVYELSEVASEVCEKVYSTVMNYVWDVGEIMIIKSKMERAKDWYDVSSQIHPGPWLVERTYS